jgi:DNA-binding XRE family transcriptional regulator
VAKPLSFRGYYVTRSKIQDVLRLVKTVLIRRIYFDPRTANMRGMRLAPRATKKDRTGPRVLPAHAQRLGHNINLLRQRRRFSQELLAELLGITARYLQKIEAGSCVPSLTMLVKLRKALRVKWDILFRDM